MRVLHINSQKHLGVQNKKQLNLNLNILNTEETFGDPNPETIDSKSENEETFQDPNPKTIESKSEHIPLKS